MAHEIYRVSSFQKVGPFTLRVQFDDDTSQTIDFRPVLKGELYGPLQELTVFDQVRIDPEVHTLVWPNGADFDPAILHNWSESGPALEALAKQWVSKNHALTGSATRACRSCGEGTNQRTSFQLVSRRLSGTNSKYFRGCSTASEWWWPVLGSRIDRNRH